MGQIKLMSGAGKHINGNVGTTVINRHGMPFVLSSVLNAFGSKVEGD